MNNSRDLIAPELLKDGRFRRIAVGGRPTELTFAPSAKAGCSSYHSGPSFTGGKIHDVGLNEPGDIYSGHNPPSLLGVYARHNPPSLLGVYDKESYLHGGRALHPARRLNRRPQPRKHHRSWPLERPET